MTLPIRDAATTMVLRDGPAGIEVLMMRRATDAAFVGGAHVFPGGAIDPPDLDERWGSRVTGLEPAAAAARLGVDDGLAWYVAAVRELFEEAGVLPARRPDGTPLGRLGLGERLAEHRRAVDAGHRPLIDVLDEEDLLVDLTGVHVVSHWITPEGQPRRFDTRFFVVAAPEGQEASHDGRETTEGVWVRPSEALRRHRDGEITLILPTIRNLEALSCFSHAGSALEAAARCGPVPTVAPRREVTDDGRERFVAPDATGTEWADGQGAADDAAGVGV